MCALCVDLLELYRMRKCSWSNVSRIVQISSKLAEVTFGYRRGASDVAGPAYPATCNRLSRISAPDGPCSAALLLHVLRFISIIKV
jgi:hypothetical protein